MTPNSSSQELRNLSLTFYGYHLRNSINQGEKTVFEANQLWQQLINLGHTLNIPKLQNLKSELICYHNNQYQPELEDKQSEKYFSLLHHQQKGIDLTIPALNGLEIKGFVTPFRLHDSYAIDLTLSPKNPLTPDQLPKLNLSSRLQPSLGQSLLLYAEPKVSLGDYLNLAKNCINQLFTQPNNLELTAKGSLLNCPIFTYENGKTDPSKHHHILIWFNPNSNVTEKIDRANKYLIFLLWSRHKILYAYNQSRICVSNIKKRHSEIEQQVNNFSQIAQSYNRLKQFKALLTPLPQKSLKYSQLLRELSDHQNTIKANEKSYSNYLTKLEKLPDSDSNFLQPFLKQINNKFKLQIKTDLRFFSPTHIVFEELINNIRGIVAIDQIESDRSFQLDLQKREQQFHKALKHQEKQWTEKLRQQDEKDQRREKTLELWIAFFGTSLAVSGISTGVIPEPGQKIINNLSLNLPSFCISNELVKSFCSNSFDILFHIMVGILFAIPVAIAIGLIQKFIK